jgi:hypothetical protein
MNYELIVFPKTYDDSLTQHYYAQKMLFPLEEIKSSHLLLPKEHKPKIDTNAKKVMKQIQLQFENTFEFSQTKLYFTHLFYPTLSEKEYEKRKNFIQNLQKNYQPILLPNVKELTIFKPLKHSSFQFATFSKQIQDRFYQDFQQTIPCYSQEDIEHGILSEQEIIITDEYLPIEQEQLNYNEVKQIILGEVYDLNKEKVKEILKWYSQSNISEEIQLILKDFFSKDIFLDNEISKEDLSAYETRYDISEIHNYIYSIEKQIQELNETLKQIVSNQTVSLQGEDLVKVMASGDISTLQEKINQVIKEKIQEKEQEIIAQLKKFQISVSAIVEEKTYPVQLDKEIFEEILHQFEKNQSSLKITYYKTLGKIPKKDFLKLVNLVFIIDLCNTLYNKTQDHRYPEHKQELQFTNAKNLFIQNPTPINYQLNTLENPQKTSILTGANSGGKTTLLELVLQLYYLDLIGLPLPVDYPTSIPKVEEIIYLKKFTGTLGSGAFEQTIRSMIEILNTTTKKLVLIDEFEAVTEPGAAAKILYHFLLSLEKQGHFAVAASHLGVELQEVIKEHKVEQKIRIDGISASGIDEQGNVITNHQPQYNQLGKSTPELILKKILNDTDFWKNKSNQLQKELDFFFK